MAILKCKMCGGDIELSQDKTFGTCEFCGSTMTFPKVDDEQRAAAFNRGNHFRRIGEFDKALAVYERIVQEDENDAEAHWCCALCRFGIEYVEDPNTFEYLPTCHRASFDSFLEDVDYLAALEHSDGITRRQYQKDAAKIAEVQRGILATSQNEEPFDVFICYKESEEDGRRTRDSLYAQDIYYQLTEQGRRVFFSRITLEDKAGTEYEPYIFAALNSAKVMILVTTSAEHANAVWVKNEWSRFLSLMRKDRSKLLLPCYRDMDPYDLPEALSVLQSYDMSKIGFIQDLIRGVNKVLEGSKPQQAVKETVVVQQQSGHAAPLLERAFMFLEDGDWAKADEFCEQVLNLEPKNALAYLGKLMAELKVNKREHLKDQPQPFDDRNNYQKALRFADGKLKTELSGVIVFINDRNETTRKEGIYQNGLSIMREQTETGYRKAEELFVSIADFQDSSEKAEECRQKAELARKEKLYQTCAKILQPNSQYLNTITNWQAAIEGFVYLKDYKDSCELAEQCREKLYALLTNELETSTDVGKLTKVSESFVKMGDYKEARDKAQACLSKQKDISLSNAVRCMNSAGASLDALETALHRFQRLSGWRDADQLAETCRRRIKQIRDQEEAARQEAKRQAEAARLEAERQAEAARLEAERKAEAARLEAERKAEAQRRAEIKKQKQKKAITVFLIVLAFLVIAAFFYWYNVVKPQQAYDRALELYAAGKYEEAITAFESLDGYKDSAVQIKKCETAIQDEKYATALELYNAGKYEEAITAFTALNGYGDSDAQLEKCYIGKYGEEKYSFMKNIKIGDTYLFGSYEQDRITANGKEEIEWIVLDKNGMSLLLISKYALDGQQYNASNSNVTWEKCSLRYWLNETFLNIAFNSEEQNHIISTTLTTENSSSSSASVENNTTDKVFLLNGTEAKQYFKTDNARQCELTEYAKYQSSSYTWSSGSKLTTCPWWLRSSGYIALVNDDGAINNFGNDVLKHYSVRPAMWISLGENLD